MRQYKLNQNVRHLRHCNHYFHQDCIDTWFRGNVYCPTCRHDIREVNENNNAPRNNRTNVSTFNNNRQ